MDGGPFVMLEPVYGPAVLVIATLVAVAVGCGFSALLPVGAGKALLGVSPKPPPRQHQPDRFPKT